MRHHPARRPPSDRWERVARFIGTPKYLIIQSTFVCFWIFLNVTAYVQHWDPYPFILLNLLFSTQASYAAPIIQLAANGSEERDRQQAALDYQHNVLTMKLAHDLHAYLVDVPTPPLPPEAQ
jgi:uncharacterized membrane protein